MKSTLAVLLATTAALGALGLPALATLRASAGPCTNDVCSAVLVSGGTPAPLIRVSGDDDHDDDHGRDRRAHRHDDDDCDDDDCDDDDDDESGRPGARRTPAPAGSVAPPVNGLFGNGAPPVAVTR